MKEWKHLFSVSTLKSGYELFCLDCIQQLSSYEFIVKTIKNYHVKLDIVDGQIVNIQCNCHTYENGELCAHIAACFIFMEYQALSMSLQYQKV